MNSRRLSVVVLLALQSFMVCAADVDLSGFQRVLLPIYMPDPLHGLFGSTFSTESIPIVYCEEKLRVFPDYTQGAGEPGIGELPPEYPFLILGHTPSAGRFVFFDRADLRIFHWVQSASASGQVFSANLGPIWPTSFLTRRGFILGVPFTFLEKTNPDTHLPLPAERRTLWIYSGKGAPGDRFRVTLMVQTVVPPPDYLSFEVATDQRDGTDASFPYFTRIPLPDICIPSSAQTPCRPTSSIVRIDPENAAEGYWAMVSVVDNTTQAVRVFSIQP